MLTYYITFDVKHYYGCEINLVHATCMVIDLTLFIYLFILSINFILIFIFFSDCCYKIKYGEEGDFEGLFFYTKDM